jgi:hypothetical protein
MKERIVWVLFLSIILAFLFDRFRPIVSERQQELAKRFWIIKTYNPNKYNCVIYGDSRTYRGISPAAVVSEIPGYSAINFGYSSGSFSEFMLDKVEEKFDTDQRNGIIILGITPFSLTPRAITDSHIKQELARKKEEVWETIYLQPVKLFFEPHYFHWSGEEANPVIYTQEYNNNGWVASDKEPTDVKEALPRYVINFEDNKVSAEVVEQLMKRVNKWVNQGIRVFGVRPPSSTEMVKLENEISGFDEKEFTSKFEKNGGKWITIDTTGLKSYDGSHLRKQSAITFSKSLGEKIQESLE